MPKKPVVLIIRDGWGINPGGRERAVENGDATLLARTPFHDHLYAAVNQFAIAKLHINHFISFYFTKLNHGSS